MKPRPDKLPAKRAGLSWGRRTDGGLVTWRLFRRDYRNAVHACQVTLDVLSDARYAAHQLRMAKRRLRDLVDEIDLRRLAA
jgi:hypothetical protein